MGSHPTLAVKLVCITSSSPYREDREGHQLLITVYQTPRQGTRTSKVENASIIDFWLEH